MVFLRVESTLVEVKAILLHGETCLVFVCVILVSHVHDSYRYQFALFSETQTRVKLDHRRDTYIENTGKIVTALRLGQRQGCKKHLNFIPGIVTAFQSGLGQN